MNQRTLTIRQYKPSDKKQILNLMQEFTKFYKSINPFRNAHPNPRSAIYFTNKMFRLVKQNNGMIYVAENNKNIIGFISIYIKKQPFEDTFEDIPMLLGHINDLFVKDNYRGQKVGQNLLVKADHFFKQHSCTHITLNVYGFNTKAHQFYESLGYTDRTIEMIKTL